MNIAIIGAGHAGVEAAKTAAEAGAAVTLFGAEAVPPYFRPRLVALAFGQVEVSGMLQHPDAWYAQRQITLRLNTPVTRLDPGRMEVTAAGATERFDGIVLAGGALPIALPFAESAPARILPLWNSQQAAAIRTQIRPGARLIVIGGGILGLEAALRAVHAGMQVHIVERMPQLMPAQFGPRASRVLLKRLQAQDIAVTTGATVTGAETTAGAVRLRLDTGATLEAELVLLSIGARPDLALAQAAGLTTARGLVVNANLRTAGGGAVFGAGDAVQFEGITRCSVREAAAQGRLAGANAVAAAQGRPLQSYQPQTLPLTFKHGEFEIYAVGKPGGPGTEEVCLDGTTDLVLRSLVKLGGATVGVQMIGTRAGFDDLASHLHE